MRDRGWVEKITPKTKRFHCGAKSDSNDDDVDKSDDELDEDDLDERDILISRALREVDPHLQFVPLHRIDFNHVPKEIILNHFPKSQFVTKTGLTLALKNMAWFSDRHADEFYPRCYILGDKDDNAAFQDDFRTCAMTAFLKTAEKQNKAVHQEDYVEVTPPGFVDECFLDFALDTFQKHFEFAEQGSIAESIITLAKQTSINMEEGESTEQWNKFLEAFYKVAYSGYHIKGAKKRADEVSNALSSYYMRNAQADIEGEKNLWIVKPGAMSRGRGIAVYQNLKEITDILGPDLTVIANNRWVAQKYIERPLLINGVKFDIRQWFLITGQGSLNCWMYKRAYVRFATTKFNLDSLDAQVHLTNNAIQKNYSIDADIQDAVPEEKMWFSEELDEYLKSLGHGNAYQEKIFEDMKNILIESCLSSQENSTHRKNSFELFGADFMLDEKLNVWLIEINQGPTMSTATKVSDELVGEMLEDMVKVVVDRRARGGRNADTGNFQQVYRQGNADPPPFTGTALSVEGKVCYKPRPKQRTFVKCCCYPRNKHIPISKSCRDKDANENDEDDDEKEQAFEQRVYSWDHDRIERLAQPRHVKKRREDADQKRIEMRLKKPPSGKVESPKPIMTITSQTTVVQRKSSQSQSSTQQASSASTCSSGQQVDEYGRGTARKARTRTCRAASKSAANKFQQQKTRPSSSRSEYIPTQSEYRLAQKEIAIDVMHTLDEHRVRNAPSTIRYSSSNPVIPSRTSPRKTPRQSNCVEQKILYPLRFTEKRAKNAQQAANKKDYWKYQLSSSSTQKIDGREVTRDLIRAKTTLNKASLFRPVYALDVNNKVVLGDQSLSQLPVIMPLRCAQRGKAAQSERMFSSAEQPADNVLQQRGDVHKGIAEKAARIHKAKPYCIKIPLSLAPRHYHPSST
ncbi:unnamed protein product [Oikopleura dioica]|uniref:Uncharacterized protein n=2 Tax=Oikopleura dioica TaxID=34765 RepID=E4YQ73_OIKDI|nr:unnamed protein product [Oikopleura dioica]